MRSYIAARNRKMRDPKVWMAKAQRLNRLKRRTEAKKWLRRIVSTFPKSREAADAREMLTASTRSSRSR